MHGGRRRYLTQPSNETSRSMGIAVPGGGNESKRAQGRGRDKIAHVAPSFWAPGPMRLGQLQSGRDNDGVWHFLISPPNRHPQDFHSFIACDSVRGDPGEWLMTPSTPWSGITCNAHHSSRLSIGLKLFGTLYPIICLPASRMSWRSVTVVLCYAQWIGSNASTVVSAGQVPITSPSFPWQRITWLHVRLHAPLMLEVP